MKRHLEMMKRHLEMMKHFSVMGDLLFEIVLGRLVVKRRFELEFQRYFETPIELQSESQSGIDPEMQQCLDLRRCFEMPTGPESELDLGTQHSCDTAATRLESLGLEMGLGPGTALATET